MMQRYDVHGYGICKAGLIQGYGSNDEIKALWVAVGGTQYVVPTNVLEIEVGRYLVKPLMGAYVTMSAEQFEQTAKLVEDAMGNTYNPPLSLKDGEPERQVGVGGAAPQGESDTTSAEKQTVSSSEVGSLEEALSNGAKSESTPPIPAGLTGGFSEVEPPSDVSQD